MKWRIAVIGWAVVSVTFLVLADTGVKGTSKQVPNPEPIPASLDQFYPPASPAPAYFLAMMDLAGAFSGTISDVLEGDLENGRLNFGALTSEYARVSEMIPEWKDKYPIAPLEALESAMAVGDVGKIMAAVESVGAVCHSCHLTAMAPVQQKFRWGDFGALALTDPLTGQDVSFARLMLMMETNFAGIANNLKQGQTDNAVRQFEGFRARFQEISNACEACHETDRYYFVSDDVTGQISQLQAELNKTAVDADRVNALILGIGQESCAKCHLVHVPAAYSQQVAALH